MARKTSAEAKPGQPFNPAPGQPRPDTLEAALADALRHAQNALAEGLLAARSLLDAMCLSLYGKPASQLASEEGDRADPRAHRSDGMQAIAAMASTLESFASRVRGDDESLTTEGILVAVLDALDAEISRWEEHSKSDIDARAVLRAFLGLREILWEFGVRRPASGPQQGRHRRESGSQARPRAGADPGQTQDRRPDDDAAPASKSGEANPPAVSSPRAPSPRRSRRPRVQRVEVQS